MLDSETIKKIQNTSIEERIETIYLLLDSLKQELKNKSKSSFIQPSFKVSSYSLGADISVNRDEIYQEIN
jgi:hypothetical protein